MEQKITTKFIIASDQDITVLIHLMQTISRETFGDILNNEQLESYFSASVNKSALKAELNSMSNQWLIVYQDERPAGYACLTTKGERPKNIAQKRVIRIAGFGTLREIDDRRVRESLYEKCMSVSKSYEGIWITEYVHHPLLDYFESKGFTRLETAHVAYDFPLPAVCLLKNSF